ncbi:condensin-2 complex subunit D3-like, partial [Lingula anatina]|uniref:Condensin-2 complex subunit D3-like n=1 Tax=Lingula anatina TaxID=7574 RepID=A0A1S3KEF4_LINAN
MSQSFLIQMVLARCSDVNSSVRSRAIAGFSQCVASKDSAVGLTIKEMFTPRNGPLGRVPISRVVPTPETQRTAPASEGQGSEGHAPQETETSSDKTIDETSDKTVATEGQALEGPPAAATVDPKESTPLPVAALAVQLTPGAEFSLADGKGVVSMLRRRACDEKVNVRKAALQALENVIRMEGAAFNKQDLDILNERCQDPALSVRKQAMMSLTQLLSEMPDNRTVQSLWLDGVLPMVMDRETGAQERCMEIVQDILLNNIVPYHRSTEPEHKMAWSILGIMAGNEGVDLRRFLQRACQHLSRQGQLKASVVSVLQTHIGTENNAGVWMLLAEMAPHLGKFNSSFVLDYWDTNMSSATEVDFSTMGRVLTVLGCLAKHLPSDVRLKVA